MDTSNKKVNQILEAAESLFYRYGMKKVTVEDICTAAKVSKMTFYKHFRNKDDLVLKMMKALVSESTEKYKEILARDIPYPEKVNEVIRMKLSFATKMSGDFVQEYLEIANPDILNFLQSVTAGSIQLLLDDFRSAAEEGWIRKDVKPEFLIYFINHMSYLLKDPALMSMFNDPSEAINELMNFFYYGVMSRDKK